MNTTIVRHLPQQPVVFQLCLVLLVFMFSLRSVYASNLVQVDPQQIKAEAWLIMDGDSGQILGESNAHAQRAPASLTKMMVAYLTLQQVHAGKLSMNEVLTVPPEVDHVASDETRMYLHPGELVKVSDLLTGLLVTSANDAAVTLSSHIAGNMNNFVGMMNQTAKQLGMLETQYANVSGITQDGHYTTAYDMAVLSKAILRQYPEYTDFSRLQHFSYGSFSEAATNRALKSDPSVDGMKTGYTKAAGYNIVISARRAQNGLGEGRRIFVAVMGSTSANERARTAEVLLNAAYQQTYNVQLLKRHQPVAEVKLWQAKQDQLIVRAPDNVFISLPYPSVNLDLPATADTAIMPVSTVSPVPSIPALNQRYIVSLKQDDFAAPLLANAVLGQLKIEYAPQQAISIDLVNDAVVEPAGFFKRSWDTISMFFHRLFKLQSHFKQLV